ncbi:MAG: AIR synthase-related protein, partial [Planctomycetota bacterium]
MTAAPASDLAASAPRVVDRIEVWPAHEDPAPPPADWADALPGLAAVTHVRVYLLERPADAPAYHDLADALLVDPVAQRVHHGIGPVPEHARALEVHHKPGVMDPVAQTITAVLRDLRPDLPQDLEARTADRTDLAFTPDTARPSDAALRSFADTRLANAVIHNAYLTPHHPEAFAHPGPYHFKLRHIPIRGLDDDALATLSRQAHLFLSLEEMKTIQAHFDQLDREPTDIELETLAQTWSEHCVHKTLKATIHYTPTPPHPQAEAERSAASGTNHSPNPDPIFQNKPHHTLHDDGSVTIHNLLKATVAAATFTLRDQHPGMDDWLVSVFDDNAGIVKLDDHTGVAIKVETHNHPSAIEPYGGAATGIGGCIRDIMGTGLFARPVANTSAYCTAPPDTPHTALPNGVIRPRRLLEQVVAGVRDYGNRMGIPTVNGCTHFHPNYVGNPLVFAGCIGTIPLDKCFGTANPADLIVAVGGRTGRDGIHGATFSSAELTDTHAGEFGHAVQIGNAITQKRAHDALLAARDHPDGPLFSAITDCGAGGFSSAIGEMGEHVGAEVDLDQAPLKYAGLSYTEVWISEAQERMVLAVPPDKLDALQALCDDEGVDLAVLGRFGVSNYPATPDDGQAPVACPQLVLRYQGHEVGRLSMPFLHEGLPKTTRQATAPSPTTTTPQAKAERSAALGTPTTQAKTTTPNQSPRSVSVGLQQTLHTLLAHSNIASKQFVVRQYDHEVQAATVVKPLVGPQHLGHSDAAVVRPIPGSPRAIAIANGVCPWLADPAFATNPDTYQATLHAIDEAIRNAVCVGATPAPPTSQSTTPQAGAERSAAPGTPNPTPTPTTTPLQNHGAIAILDNFCWPSCDDPQTLGSLVRAAEACYDGALAFAAPFVSGKDSLHNQFTTEDGRLIAIPPTLLVTALAVLPDAARCVTADLKQPGNTLLLVGDTANTRLGGSHLAMIGHAHADADLSIPTVDLALAPRTARAVAALIQAGHVAAAHDCAEGGLLTAAAEMAIAANLGITLNLPPHNPSPPQAGAEPLPGGAAPGIDPTHHQLTTPLFQEAPSRYLLELPPDHLPQATAALDQAGIPHTQVGTVTDT